MMAENNENDCPEPGEIQADGQAEGNLIKPEQPTEEQADRTNNSDAMKACIQNGYSEELVKKAAESYTQTTDTRYFKATDLFEILLDMEESGFLELSTSNTNSTNAVDTRDNTEPVSDMISDEEDLGGNLEID